MIFAAGRYGFTTLLIMSILFAASTIGTYVALCVLAARAAHRIQGRGIERYGEIISGAFIATLGIIFLIWPLS